MMQKPDIKNKNVSQEKYTILQRQSLNYNNEINSKKNVASNKKNNGIFKKIVYNFSDFFKNNLKRKTLVVYIISLLLLGIFYTMFLSQNNNTNDIAQQAQSLSNGVVSYKSQILKEIVKSKVPIIFLCIFSGIVPFFYIPALCTYFVSNYTVSVIVKAIESSSSKVNLVTLSISSVLQLLGYSLAIATGIYYCINETKHFRYDESKHTTFNDIKYKFYEYKNDKKNQTKAYDVKKKREAKKEKLNVKIDYFNIMISFIVSILIVAISSLIALI